MYNNIFLRKATYEDMDLIFKWANDSAVRNNAFNQEKIEYQEHKKWFKSRLEDKNTLIYILTKNNKDVGQIRVDIDNKVGEIDFSIAKSERGNGFGTVLLELLIDKINNNSFDIYKLIGKVKKKNMASKKVFIKADFNRIKKENKNYDIFYYKIKEGYDMNKQIKLTSDRIIGENKPAYIIAEMSANHAGSKDRALEIIYAAKKAGADCVKVQTYTPDTMTIDSDQKWFQIDKGTWEGENLYSLYQKAYTPWEWQEELKNEAENIGIDFFSTPYENTAVDFLEDLGVEFYKVASFSITNIPFLKYLAQKGKPIIMSTGMATLAEIDEAVRTIREAGNDQLALLNCSSAYPSIADDMNLKNIKNLEETFGVPIGLSDHSLGSVAAVTSVAMGAKIIEKHFCMSREIENPDASFSMEPDEFKKMVDDIRAAERAIGKIDYSISEKEKNNRLFRRSIFAVKDIKSGEELTEENIRVIRPGHGLKPKNWDNVLHKKALKDIEKGTPLNWDLIK